ncbi:hypothetical protein DF152_17275 [Burkholderia cenocepacia]|nr:hypothetical protein DF152_17275 [Burkholderia cenocepacia]
MQVLTLRGPAVSHVIETYGNALTELRKYVPDLVLVGGAVRDVYFKRPVKDLDFMTCDDQAVRVISEYYGETIRNCLDEPVNEYEGDSNTLIAAYETASKGANVLRVSDIHLHIALFPDSLSQIWTDGEQVYATPGFNKTAADRRVVCNDRMRLERMGRLMAKYPDFTFVPPPQSNRSEVP